MNLLREHPVLRSEHWSVVVDDVIGLAQDSQPLFSGKENTLVILSFLKLCMPQLNVFGRSVSETKFVCRSLILGLNSGRESLLGWVNIDLDSVHEREWNEGVVECLLLNGLDPSQHLYPRPCTEREREVLDSRIRLLKSCLEEHPEDSEWYQLAIRNAEHGRDTMNSW